MPKFLGHEGLAAGVLNHSYNSGSGTYAAWETVLGNRFEVLNLVVDRMGSDYGSLMAKLRKPYMAKELVSCLVSGGGD